MVVGVLDSSDLGSSLDISAMQQPEEQPPKMSNGDHGGGQGEAEGAFVEGDEPQPVISPEVMTNGGNQLPPQQVYVSAPTEAMQNGITGLESQLLGLQMNPGMSGEAIHNEEGVDNDELEDDEIEPVKLFVGQVRKRRRSSAFQTSYINSKDGSSRRATCSANYYVDDVHKISSLFEGTSSS